MLVSVCRRQVVRYTHGFAAESTASGLELISSQAWDSRSSGARAVVGEVGGRLDPAGNALARDGERIEECATG